MKYQVLGRKRRLKKGDIPYDIVSEFDDLVQLYYVMDKADKRKYSEVLVIDTYTDQMVANREFELHESIIKKRRR